MDLLTCAPSGELSFPPDADLMYGFPVDGWRHCSPRPSMSVHACPLLAISLIHFIMVLMRVNHRDGTNILHSFMGRMLLGLKEDNVSDRHSVP